MKDENVITNYSLFDDKVIDNTIRPETIKEYIGQNDVKDNIMYFIIRNKFIQNDDLMEKLVATGNAELIEGNWWKDTYWGVCEGIGENKLGKILMQVRKECIDLYIPKE